MIEEIKFSESLTIWKSKYEFKNRERCIELSNKHIKELLKTGVGLTTDAYSYFVSNDFKESFFKRFNYDNELNNIIVSGINDIIELHNRIYNIEYNKLYSDNWINTVKVKPIQKDLRKKNDLVFHQHTDLNRKHGMMEPDFTYVTYIQMPNNLSGKDGVLYMKDYEGNVFDYLPEEGDVIIMKGDIEHVPNLSPNSTIDRIVMAGNLTLKKEKNIKTLL